MSGSSSSLPAVAPPEGADPVVAEPCHNCGAPAPGKFCSNCGQTTAVHMPTLFEFLHEFVSHHIALEGTLYASLKRMLLSPGGLTLDFFAGRRARYVAPLRLYLTFNVIFFLALSLATALGPGVDADAKKALAKLNTRDASVAIDEAAKEIDADPDMTPDQRRIASEKLAMLKMFAARAAIPVDGAVTSAGSSESSLHQEGPPAAAASSSAVLGQSAPNAASSADLANGINTSRVPVPALASGPAAAAGSSGTPGEGSSVPTPASKSATRSANKGLHVSVDDSGVVKPKIGASINFADDDDDASDKADDLKSNQDDARNEVLDNIKDALAESSRPLDKPITKAARDNFKPHTQLEGFKDFENKIIPAWVDEHAPAVRRHLDQIPERSASETTQRLKDNILRYAPYTLLALLPVCAFLLQFSFVGCHRGYVENLVTSLHGHTFLFLVLLVFLLPLGGLVSTIWILLAVIHMMVALSRIYGSRGIALFMRLGVLAVTYSIAFAIATSMAVIASLLT